MKRYLSSAGEPPRASPMPLTLRFREPVGASPGPEFADYFACKVARGMRLRSKSAAMGASPRLTIVGSILLAWFSLTLVGAMSAEPEKPLSFQEPAITESDRDHWSFRPIQQIALPLVKQGEWLTNGIDLFVLAKLEASNLEPAQEADRITLLRRLKLDLLGLPPTIEEMNTFEADPAFDAYERLVDQFLASPSYGERWAQTWLDLASFAETDGFEHDRVRYEAWRFRDWVIRSLNDDLPYDQFVFQQLAGDGDERTEQHIATMFCLAGPDMPDLNDQQLRRHDRLNDLTSTVGSVLLGLQFQCARCHDHKSDPISQADFYRLRAVFESSIPQLERDKPFNSFASMASTIPARFYFRGDLQQAGPTVRAGLPRIATEATQDIRYLESANPRAEFARWLFEDKNPLTARVIVNRLWQAHFGRGLIESPSDLGVVASGPTHPELLDWLAMELRRDDWSLKTIHRKIVLSSTYRQRSNAEPHDLIWKVRLEIDPRNLLYSRFPRHRLDAEIIRDSMLAAAGLLNLECGGEGVMPPIPDELVGTLLKGQWKSSEDAADHWRRSIYIFARRNLRYPIFESFDRPDAVTSCGKRDFSTTAIQALQMLNSQLTIQCSRSLCDRILDKSLLSEESQPVSDPIDRLFRYTLGRRPTERESEILHQFLGRSDASFQPRLLAACLAVLNANEFIYID